MKCECGHQENEHEAISALPYTEECTSPKCICDEFRPKQEKES